ncbi:MAG: class I SAM-dependent methyltransferase [Candidatus Devosia phytovorans]|uniref:Class I SAM-dependent methyltransferase n=1 Tax=Candidatus Devosia phytovorans TaxID=3121372 RepID=A0AAJ5VUE7_9HYPH|nr:class I SAM-dependent methyltransferase [Devosia sp.]WEK03782.1 MAG: class I SAM-dependent methyltransferase [Devosia sp.]
MIQAECRACGAPLKRVVCDLGLSPISNAFITAERAAEGEMFYPLKACVCEACWLVQLESSPSSSAHFHEDYVYFSSFSTGWVNHARSYVEDMTRRFVLSSASRVMEIASNDGYLLQFFVKAGIPALGIEPTANTAAAARLKGVETEERFFGADTASELAARGWTVDLLLGNNVLAHVPDINDFIGGVPKVLKSEGIATFEFPHLLSMLAQNQFDTIYHEHYSYLSLTALLPILARAGLRVFDVETLSTHGGSLRLYLCHDAAGHMATPAVAALLALETEQDLAAPERYDAFAQGVVETKRALLAFLLEAQANNKSVAAYGAAAKGNTLLNYCGVRPDMVAFVADKNPTKQGRLLPGSRIPVLSPQAIAEHQPDYLLILPWNIKDEVMAEMDHIRSWGGQFVVPIPTLTVVP